ncbi:hypothetical protein [Aeromonas salmonicida]|uniref:hypothetical protein n=1 Tax=Aeromonas salmonicida TaxID=645 RepID=UPI003D1BACB1
MPTNKDRAAWAETALEAFAGQVRHDGKQLRDLPPGDREDMIGDLICDLLHYADQQGFDAGLVLSDAENMFEMEKADG